MAKTLHRQFREEKACMQAFVNDGDIQPNEADKIVDYLRRAMKALRADKA